MALWIGNDKVGQLWVGSGKVQTMWRVVGGVAVKIYEAVRSCFGSGVWINGKTWANKEVWRNK